MTKYVINSGGLKNHPKRAEEFFNEVVKGLGDEPNILLCMYAKSREQWEEKFVEYKEGFKESLSNGISPAFKLAIPDKFIEQVQNTDVLIIYGGDDHLVQYWLKQFDIPKIWEGKTIATTSAGSDALAKHFWTCDWRQCMDGLGILPIKFLPHFQSSYGSDDPRGLVDWKKAYEELKEFGDKSLPIHALKEGEFIVIEN